MEWLALITTTGASVMFIGIAIWLFRHLILTRLTNSVKYEFEEKLENIKANYKKNEELLKAELKAQESQINTLKSGALSGMINRQAVLYERQVKAGELLWNTMVSLSPGMYISSLINHLKLDAVLERAERDSKIRELFKIIGGDIDEKILNVLNSKDVSQVRPFISPLAWALYSAYSSIIMYAVVNLRKIKDGVNVDFLNFDYVTSLVKTTLPHQEKNIEKYGIGFCHHVLEELESKLLIEIGNMLQGKTNDKESIEQAREILKQTDSLFQEMNAANKQSEF